MAYPSSIVAGKFSGDGQTELAVAGLFSNNVAILENNGLGSFDQPAGSLITLGDQSYPVAALVAAKFNGDGLPISLSPTGTPRT